MLNFFLLVQYFLENFGTWKLERRILMNRRRNKRSTREYLFMGFTCRRRQGLEA